MITVITLDRVNYTQVYVATRLYLDVMLRFVRLRDSNSCTGWLISSQILNQRGLTRLSNGPSPFPVALRKGFY